MGVKNFDEKPPVNKILPSTLLVISCTCILTLNTFVGKLEAMVFTTFVCSIAVRMKQ